MQTEEELPNATTQSATIAGLNITPVSEGADFIKELIYGIPGSGKTTLAASAEDVPEMRPVLYIDIEGGTLSIKERWPNIQAVRVKTIFDKGGRAKRTAWQQLEDVYEALKKGEGGYATVIVDNMTEGYQLAMQDVMVQLIAEHPERDPDVPGMKEWGKASTQVRRWIRHMRDLNLNLILTAHEAEHTNDSGQILKYTPSLPGKLANEVAGYVDIVLYLYTKQEKEEGLVRKVQTQPAGKYIAKDRSGKLPLVLTNPTMQSIYDLVKGK